MKLEALRAIDLLQTRTIAEACKKDYTRRYVLDCVERFYNGDFGTVPEEDTAANMADLEAGTGRIVARYPARDGLDDDIYIISYFAEDHPGIDFNNTLVQYVNEY